MNILYSCDSIIHQNDFKKFVFQVWLVGDGMDDVEQWKAQNGTIFIPYSYFPPKKVRNDCIYYSTPAMKIPNELQNVHSCEVI